MKLFHFHSVESLRDWRSGDLIIMAEDMDQAMGVLKEDEEISTSVEKEIRENPNDKVRIYEKPKAIPIYGSA